MVPLVPVETLAFLIEELRVQAFSRAAEAGISVEETLEWDLADTLDEVAGMLAAAVARGGPVAMFATAVTKRLLRVSLKGYGNDGKH